MPSLAISNGSVDTLSPAVELSAVGVRYRLPRGRIRSVKEFTLLWLRRQIVFEEFWALRDVNLNIFPGEWLGVVGRNGAGKSTLLQTIARVVPPTTGLARIRGKVAALLQLGAGFDPELTGRENVFLNGTILGMRRPSIAAGFEEIVDFAELHEFIDAPLRTYSTGMAARLGFAIASASDPDILLLDETLAVGDEGFRTKCLDRMRRYSARGTAVVLVSHEPQLIVEQCSRAVWLERGRVQTTGDPSAVLDAYHAALDRQVGAPLGSGVAL